MIINSTAIEPIIPVQGLVELEDLASSVIERAARLEGRIRPQLRRDVSELTRWMHCYYSNLIEGQQTRVRDIEAALRRDFSVEPDKRNVQKLALAHLAVQRWAAGYDESPFTPTFILELHRRFYSELPPEMQTSTTSSGVQSHLEPGVLRTTDVEVGNHIGPPHELLPSLLSHFSRRYGEPDSRVRKIIAIGASHHRLAWIHPFRDGNGRVTRLFSDTLIRQLGIDGGGLWSLSRGFAVQRRDYYAMLSNADQQRSSSSAADGRGHLSEQALREFCRFVLNIMLDQIGFMEKLLELDTLLGRIEHYVRVEANFGSQAERIFFLLREALYRGEFPRGEAGRIVGRSDSIGRELLSRALGAGLLKSETPKAPVGLALPSNVLGTYFPQLFPPGQLG